MPTVFSDLLASCESARRQLLLYDAIAAGINGHCANKELKS
jgi:hypothetical protein